MAKRATLDDLLTRKKPVTRTVEIVLDGAVADEWNARQSDYNSAKAAIERQGAGDDERYAFMEAEARLEDYRPTVEDATVEMVVGSIGRRAYEALLAEHGPTKTQIAAARRDDPKAQLAFNPDTFPAALIAASVIEPKMTEDEVQELMDSEAFNAAELNTLVFAALEVNQTSKVVDLGKG